MSSWQLLVIAALLAATARGFPQHFAPPAYTSQAANILRTPGNLGQVSAYQKTIQTPYSSVSKADVRAGNDALAYAAAPRPVAYAPAPAPGPAPGLVRANLLGVAYSAAPAVAQITYTNPNDKVNYSY